MRAIVIPLFEHDPALRNVFEKERARITDALSGELVRIEHVGSTAVPGIAAKPTVDIAIAVRSFDAVERIVRAFEQLDYEYVPQYEDELPNRRYFRSVARGSSGERLFHVHVYEVGDRDFDDYVVFRDHLRAHGDDARVYEALKRYLATAVPRDQYPDEKGSFVRGILAASRAESVPLGPLDVVLRDHDPAWAEWFVAERALLLDALGDRFLRIEHVGSTSIPKISAKPLVDIGATMASIEEVESLILPLAGAGYLRRADIEATLPPRRFFVKGKGPAGSRFHLHIFDEHNEDFERMLAFRDWMRAHPLEATIYDDLKRDLAARLTRPEYTRAKAPYIAEILERAAAR